MFKVTIFQLYGGYQKINDTYVSIVYIIHSRVISNLH